MIKWMLLIAAFVALFGVLILGVIRLKKLLKEDLEDYENARYEEE